MKAFLALRLSLLAVAFAQTACLQIGLPGDGDAGAVDAGRTADAGGAADSRVSDAADIGCVVDPFSRVTLCRAIAICPGLLIDADRFPNCGFRAGAGTIDMQCVCDSYLCPLGATLTCGQARDLLATQFEIFACSQVSEGRCALRSTTPPTGTSCDKNCAATCGNDPGCLRLCGC